MEDLTVGLQFDTDAYAVYEGHPDILEGREERELRTYCLLDALQISYRCVDHPEAKTIADCHQVDTLLGTPMCKNLFLCNRQKTDFYLLMLPGDKVFKTKDLSGQLGVARLSFADDSYMEEFLDIHPGSVSVLGLMNDVNCRVRLLVDEEIFSDSFIGCHPCKNTSSLLISHDDLFLKFLPYVKHEATIVRL